MKADDYEVVKVIGRGAFGEVQLVRMPYCVTCVNNVSINLEDSCSGISIILSIFFLLVKKVLAFPSLSR